ncbi:hypothetical protein KOR34_46270 [Posidoniimonas corsicana]|uniref:Uncharacterized protein n=1 Tax=Posidoniimonas corsicana TaxID=1938618 RepID=A0A5C5UYD0_9BACT|nr:hypothetical protein KOR34_46270 [Posidoniimonas corsicana]
MEESRQGPWYGCGQGSVSCAVCHCQLAWQCEVGTWFALPDKPDSGTRLSSLAIGTSFAEFYTGVILMRTA